MNKFPELENLIKIAKILDALKIPYYITGGFAVSVHGRPRFTADIDIVIKMRRPEVDLFSKKILDVFQKGYVDKGLIENALSHYGEFNVIDPESGLKIDFFIAKKNEFEKMAFKRAQDRDIDYKVKFISPEDLIISKLIWFKDSQSTRQLEDIVSVMDIQKDIDQKYLNSWLKKLNLAGEWHVLEKMLDKNRQL